LTWFVVKSARQKIICYRHSFVAYRADIPRSLHIGTAGQTSAAWTLQNLDSVAAATPRLNGNP
jgi:hypothetical protein